MKSILWRTWFCVAVSLVLWRFAAQVTVVALDHRVVIQPFTDHFLLLGTWRGRHWSIGQLRAQLILHIKPLFRNHGSWPTCQAPMVLLSVCSKSRHVNSWFFAGYLGKHFYRAESSLLWLLMERVRATVSVSHLPLRVCPCACEHTWFFVFVYVPYTLGPHGHIPQ